MRSVCAKLATVRYLGFITISLVLLLTADTVFGRTPTERTFEYEPKVVTLSGTLLTRSYPGPPNYESVINGDRPERVWLIRLPYAISM